MRRIVLVLVLVVVLAIAGYMLLRPKGAPAKAKPSTALTDSTQFGTPAAKGKVAGKLKASTAADRTAKAKQIKDAERARKRDLARQARDKKRLLAKFKSMGKRCIKPNVHTVPTNKGVRARKAVLKLRKVNKRNIKIKATA